MASKRTVKLEYCPLHLFRLKQLDAVMQTRTWKLLLGDIVEGTRYGDAWATMHPRLGLVYVRKGK